MRQIGKLILAAAALWSGTASATTWQPYNTCWADFDVGGGWFCGLRMAQCQQPGLRCGQSVSSEVPAPYDTTVPSPKAIALDDAGYVWLVGNDNKIYNEGLGWGQFSPAIPINCVKKLAVTGRADSNPRILALGCNGQIYRYLDGLWILQRASGGVDVSVGGTALTYLHNSNAIGTTGTGGGGVIVMLGTSTVVTEPVPGGTLTHRTKLLAGLTGYFEEFTKCSSPDTFLGTANFYSFSSRRYLSGDPAGCERLRSPSQDMLLKIVSGNRGPGSDHLWVMNTIGRVYSLND
jgi:hypothetical protein